MSRTARTSLASLVTLLLWSVWACGGGGSSPTGPGQVVSGPGGLRVELFGRDLCRSQFLGPTAQTFDLVTFYPGSPLPSSVSVRNYAGITRTAESFQECGSLDQLAAVCASPESAAAQALMAPCLQGDGRARAVMESNAKDATTYELFIDSASSPLTALYEIAGQPEWQDGHPYIGKGLIMHCADFRRYTDLEQKRCESGESLAAVLWAFVPNRTIDSLQIDLDVVDRRGFRVVSYGSSGNLSENPNDWRDGEMRIIVVSFDPLGWEAPFEASFLVTELSGRSLVHQDSLDSEPFTPGG